MSAPEQLAEYDGRIHILLNPVSTGYRRLVKSQISEVVIKYGGAVNILHSKPKEEATQDMLLSQLSEGDMLVTAGGDGLDGVAVRALMDNPDVSKELQQTPILSWYGGNANAGPGELHGKSILGTPSLLDAIRHGVVIDVHPMLGSVIADPEAIDPETEELIEYPKILALYFKGLGVSGSSTFELEQVRNHRLRRNLVGRNMVDAAAAIKGIRKSSYYIIRETQLNQEGEVIYQSEPQKVYETSVINGDRMAKFARLPSKLHEDGVWRMILTDKHIHTIMKDALKMSFGSPPGQLVDSQTTLRFDFETLNENDQLWAHFDGDPQTMPAKGTWTLKQHPSTYRAVKSAV